MISMVKRKKWMQWKLQVMYFPEPNLNLRNDVSAQRALGNHPLLPPNVSYGSVLLSTTTWILTAEKKSQGSHQLQGEFRRAKIRFCHWMAPFIIMKPQYSITKWHTPSKILKPIEPYTHNMFDLKVFMTQQLTLANYDVNSDLKYS